MLSRRHVLGLGIGALSVPLLRTARAAGPGSELHGLSVFGDLKYSADFHHFDYVNPDAPKGGMFSLIPSARAYNQSFFTFNSLNAYILKGEGAQGMDAQEVQPTLEPGRIHEACVRLDKGEKRRYHWKSSAPVDFNVHYHEGNEVFYPVKRDAMRGDGGTFVAKIAQDYCWMWAAKNVPATVTGKTISFPAIAVLAPGAKQTYTITIRAKAAGQVQFRGDAKSNEITRPLVKIETTNFYR